MLVRRTVPSLFDILFDEDFLNPFEHSEYRCPIHDVIVNDNEFVVEAMMAGVKKEDVKLEVEDKKLRIFAERKEVKDLKYNRKESFTGTYRRTFILPDGVDAENITATMEDGILRVSIPRLTEEQKPLKKQIEIK
jgi:HSP20 family protein